MSSDKLSLYVKYGTSEASFIGSSLFSQPPVETSKYESYSSYEAGEGQ